MAVKGPSPSTPAHPDLTRAQITALETYGSKATRNALLSISQPALTNPLITCLICIHPYHSANVEGNVETPVITACGHIFGNKCIKQCRCWARTAFLILVCLVIFSQDRSFPEITPFEYLLTSPLPQGSSRTMEEVARLVLCADSS